MKFNLNTFLMSLSTALDLAEEDLFGINIHHSKRVAYMSLRIAKKLKFSQEECFDLTALALLHDNGITESFQKKSKKRENQLIKLESLKEHCIIGEENTKFFPLLTSSKNIILYHHENYDGSGFFGKVGNQIPLMSQIISFADKLDFNFDMKDDSIENRKKIKNYVQENINKNHCKEIADMFFELSQYRAFWLDLKDTMITDSLQSYIPEIIFGMSYEDIYKITEVFSDIIDSKSRFTYSHSSGLINLAMDMANYYDFDRKRTVKFKIAAALHDIGKLAIPNAILDKNGALTDDEYDTIKTHTYYTNFILKSIDGFKDINHWAFCHHEKLDGSGYPFGLKANELSFEARLMACLDIYQALSENRPYRDGMSHDDVMNILYGMADQNHIDANIVSDIHLHLG